MMEAKMIRASMKKGKSCGVMNSMIYIMLALCFIVTSQISAQIAYAQQNNEKTTSNVSIKDGDEWQYFKGVEKPPRYWNQNGFDASSWLKGSAGLGYGTPLNKTPLDDMQGNYTTVYARHEFLIKNIYIVTGMTLSVICDGPFKAYINGVEVISNSAVNNTTVEELDISGFIHELLPGNNVLSVQCTNDDIRSKDFTFIPYFDVYEYQGGDAL